ncbi:MAG: hypothetical protein RMH84_06295 [Sulfolobales archaeon]|nr:hypothetical protein [Sulfolobales archaeon]MCX8208786.1 hypothetical protein [Sulfolobales archaeon]MDW8011181.1 hypothetical protein [Sulfolobales archaeon]
MGSGTLVLYVRKDGDVDASLYDEKGLLARKQELTSVKHIKIEADKCVSDISFAEFENAIVVRASGKVDLKLRSGVLEVYCVGR